MRDGAKDKQAADNNWAPTWATFLALAAVLIAYPAFRMAVAYLDLYPSGDGRESWWSLWAVIMIGHWFLVALCAAAIVSEKGGWQSIGLDWRIFVRLRYLLLIILIAALAVAYGAPDYLYAEVAPAKMQSHPLGPVTAAERTFWIGMAVTAGVAEEILFRGYAITRLRRLTGLPVAIIVSIASFALMHGPSALIPQYLALYIVSGAIFTGLFVIFKYRRLELLILLHAALDLALIAAP